MMCSAARTFALRVPEAPSGPGRRRVPTPAPRRVPPRRVFAVTAGIGVPRSRDSASLSSPSIGGSPPARARTSWMSSSTGSGRRTSSEEGIASDLPLPVVRPGQCCSPRPKLPLTSSNEGVNCVSMTWRGILFTTS